MRGSGSSISAAMPPRGHGGSGWTLAITRQRGEACLDVLRLASGIERDVECLDDTEIAQAVECHLALRAGLARGREQSRDHAAAIGRRPAA